MKDEDAEIEKVRGISEEFFSALGDKVFEKSDKILEIVLKQLGFKVIGLKELRKRYTNGEDIYDVLLQDGVLAIAKGKSSYYYLFKGEFYRDPDGEYCNMEVEKLSVEEFIDKITP